MGLNLFDILSPFEPFEVTAGFAYSSLPHMACLQYTQNVLRGLSLSGINSANIVLLKVPFGQQAIDQGIISQINGTPFPFILVCPWGQESMEGGTNIRDDIGYPCLVLLCDSPEVSSKGLADLTTLERNLGWRKTVKDAFINQPAPQLNSIAIYAARYEPNRIVIPETWNKGFWQSAMVIRYLSRETRGTNN